MGGGDGEDEALALRKELERVERDLQAIDARWSSDGYQQRTNSKVLDDERATRRELMARAVELRLVVLAPTAPTPAMGTGSVRANIGGSWEPLPFFDELKAAVQRFDEPRRSGDWA